MKKLINMIVAIIILATNSNFAQKTDQDNQKFIQKIFESMTASDMVLVIKSLRAYDAEDSLDLGEISMNTLGDIMIIQSKIVYGSQLVGPVMAYEVNDDGYGNKKPYQIVPNSDDRFIGLKTPKAKGRVYMQIRKIETNQKVEFKPLAVSSKPIMYTPTAEPLKPVAPAIAQAPKPAPTQTVAPTKEVIPSGYYYNNVVNSYNNSSDGHDCSGSGCTNYACVDLAKRVYPIGAFASQPQTYGYANGGGGVSVSIWWNGASYYPYNGYWYCRNNGMRVCENDYYLLCKKFNKPETYGTPSANGYYYGAHNGSGNVGTYGNNAVTYTPTNTASGYNPPANSGNSGGYHSSGQPRTYGQ